jgi:DNA-binding GntR family transcriptional regulator
VNLVVEREIFVPLACGEMAGHLVMHALEPFEVAAGHARRGRYTALASEQRWKEAMAEHEALMEALRRRDGQRAGEILFQHDRRTGETTREMLKAKGRER